MAICRNCRYYDDNTRNGYKGYCTTYGHYVDPDSMERGCIRYEEGTGSSSGCYLTTACINAKNLPDDCHELTVLRKFRDTYMLGLENGEKEIRHYYKTAPAVVDNINKEEDSCQIWRKLYVDLVQRCVYLIDNGELDKAYRTYKQICSELENKYLS